jgi:predicted nucleic acid-binding protein
MLALGVIMLVVSLLPGQENVKSPTRELAPITILVRASKEKGRAGQIGGLEIVMQSRGDLLIACIVLANKAKLISRNLKDFQKAPGLQVENWAE